MESLPYRQQFDLDERRNARFTKHRARIRSEPVVVWPSGVNKPLQGKSRGEGSSISQRERSFKAGKEMLR
jgi:hypothetical protein